MTPREGRFSAPMQTPRAEKLAPLINRIAAGGSEVEIHAPRKNIMLRAFAPAQLIFYV